MMIFNKIHSLKIMLVGAAIMLIASFDPHSEHDYYFRIVGWAMFVSGGVLGFLKLQALKSKYKK